MIIFWIIFSDSKSWRMLPTTVKTLLLKVHSIYTRLKIDIDICTYNILMYICVYKYIHMHEYIYIIKAHISAILLYTLTNMFI